MGRWAERLISMWVRAVKVAACVDCCGDGGWASDRDQQKLSASECVP